MLFSNQNGSNYAMAASRHHPSLNEDFIILIISPYNSLGPIRKSKLPLLYSRVCICESESNLI